MLLICLLLGALVGPSLTKVYDVTTIYRTELVKTNGTNVKRVSLEVHARTNALGLPYYLPNGTIVEPSAGVELAPFSSWGASPGWLVQGWGTVLADKDPAIAPLDPGFLATRTKEAVRKNVDNSLCRLHDISRNGKISNDDQEGRPHCWNMSVPQGFRMRFELDTFLRTAEGGKVSVYDGTSSSAPLLANLTSPAVIESSGNHLYVQAEDPGNFLFNATYSARGTGVMALSGQEGAVVSPVLVTSSDKLCVSIHHYMQAGSSARLEVLILVDNAAKNPVAQVLAGQDDDWATSRFVLELDDSQKGKELRVAVVASRNGSEKVYLERVSGCNPAADEDMLLLYDDEADGYPEGPVQTPTTPITDSRCMHGLWDVDSSACICVPGYTGRRCQLPCGMNRFGHDCLGICSEFNDQCKSAKLCKYGVGCTCISGYTGEQCDTICTGSNSGPGCRYGLGSCMNDLPDRYSGRCWYGCKPGYQEPYCLEKVIHLVSPPTVTTSGHTWLTVLSDLTRSNMQGPGVPLYYQLQYKVGNNWMELEPNILSVGLEHDVSNITGLTPGEAYYVRTIIITEDFNSYQGDDVPQAWGQASCIVPETVDFNITTSNPWIASFQVDWQYEPEPLWCALDHFELQIKSSWRWRVQYEGQGFREYLNNLLAGTEYQVRLRAVTAQGATGFSAPLATRTRDYEPNYVFNLTVLPATSTEIGLEWEEPRDTAGGIREYKLLTTCNYQSCSNANCPTPSSVSTTNTSYTLAGLTPNTLYHVQVYSLGGMGDMGESTVFDVGTLQDAPQVAPREHSTPVLETSSTSLTVQWLPPAACERLNGYPHGYRYRVGDQGNWVRTPKTNVTLSGLQPNTEYVVTVLVVTSVGWNEEYPLTITARTDP